MFYLMTQFIIRHIGKELTQTIQKDSHCHNFMGYYFWLAAKESVTWTRCDTLAGMRNKLKGLIWQPVGDTLP